MHVVQYLCNDKYNKNEILKKIPDVGSAKIFKYHETNTSRLRDGCFDFGHGFDGQKFSSFNDFAFHRSSNYFTLTFRSKILRCLHMCDFFLLNFKFDLLRESWHELFILTAAQYFSDTDISLLYEEHRSNFGSLDIEEQTSLFKDTLAAIKHRQVDPIEQYLLNEIILLKSGKENSLLLKLDNFEFPYEIHTFIFSKYVHS